MKKLILTLFIVLTMNVTLWGGSKLGLDFKIGTGYMDTVKTEYKNSKYETNSLSTVVLGIGAEYYDNLNIYIGSDLEFAIADDQYTNAYGSLTTAFGKVGIHIDKTIIVYGLGGFAYHDLNSQTINTSGSGIVFGGGLKLNHKQNVGMEINFKRSQLTDNSETKYYVNSMTLNCVLFF
ncbi:MAG: hypothetical protein U9Q30_00880 [Campylobacterota bacterium]|nr:hypothetical protein [Campylobacterota bacterium]